MGGALPPLSLAQRRPTHGPFVRLLAHSQVLLAVLLGGFSLGQAAPIFETFSKGCAAAANIFRVIDRVPAIDPESEEGEVLPEEVRPSRLSRATCAAAVRV